MTDDLDTDGLTSGTTAGAGHSGTSTSNWGWYTSTGTSSTSDEFTNTSDEFTNEVITPKYSVTQEKDGKIVVHHGRGGIIFACCGHACRWPILRSGCCSCTTPASSDWKPVRCRLCQYRETMRSP